ncbi:RNA-binding protein 33 isoform 2-T2 [Synchiropus picturatus]
MSANAQGFDFDEYDKPGTERLRRKRGDDDFGSDLEEELLEEDWLSGKKNPSEMSDEELNDDLLQSDDEEQQHTSVQDISFNATYSLGTSYDHQENLQEADDAVDLGEEDVEDGYQQEGEEEFTGDFIQDQDGYQDEVLDIEINEPLESEFPDDYQTYRDGPPDKHGVQQNVTPEDEKEALGAGQQRGEMEEDFASNSQVYDTDEPENEAVPDAKEESEEEDEEDEDSCRSRFKTERKYSGVVRMNAGPGKRRDIPETLELSEKAKQDLMEMERQNQKNRYGGRGQGYGQGRGGRGRGFHHGYRMSDYRGGYRGRMHDRIHPLMGVQHSSRMAHLHQPHLQQLQSQQHHPSRPRGPPFQEHGHPLAQQPPQPLIAPRMSLRSPPLRPQLEGPPQMMSPPPPNFPHHHPQPPQPKNIHINPHFRGPAPPPVQVPLMPPAQSQPRPAVGPQRFPGLGDFHQPMPGNFSQPQRPPHHMEPFRNQPHLGPQDREGLFIGEHPDSPLYPGQHAYDHHGSLNNNNNIHQRLPGPGHMGFGPPGQAFNQQGQVVPGMFAREPPRPNLPPHQSHQGMMGVNQQGQPRPFMSPRQQFGQQGNVFPTAQGSFGMQVRHVRPVMHGPPGSQLLHQDSIQSHPPMQHQQHHRHEVPHHHQQQQLNHNESHPAMHHGQNLFDQQQTHSSLRQMTPRPQNLQQRNMSNRQRMSAPVSKQMHPQRNSNLRELPVAPDNTNNGSARPTASTNVRPVAKATQGMRQNTCPAPGGGREKGTVFAKTAAQPEGAVRTVVQSEFPSSQSSAASQDPEEDEETRQYRLKIEEQKRLREEILKKKEMRRQIQAGVRKKELLERMNSQANAATQAPNQNTAQQNLPQSHPAPLPQQQRPQFQTQPQRQFPQRTQQPSNQSSHNPFQGNPFPPNGAVQVNAPHPYNKARPDVLKGNGQPQQTSKPGPPQSPCQPNQPQQGRNLSGLWSPSKQTNNQTQSTNIQPRSTLSSPAGGAAQNQDLHVGTKRTVMQRAKVPNETQPVPQKIRVVKLSGATDPASGSPQQVSTSVNPVNQGVQRRVTMMGQQDPTGGAQSVVKGGTGNLQLNRVVVSGCGRGRGVGQRGRGRGVAPTPIQTVPENKAGDVAVTSGRRSVSIEGLSSSTTDNQLRALLRSVGPIEMFKMIPQQRKAIATFVHAQHAASFQTSFHRHMIDLAHIDVTLIN